MVDPVHVSRIAENTAATQTGKANSTSNESKQDSALDSQFDATLEALNKESVSMMESAQNGELVADNEGADTAMMGGKNEEDDQESFLINHGVAGRDGQNGRNGREGKDEKEEQSEEGFIEPVAKEIHDQFERELQGITDTPETNQTGDLPQNGPLQQVAMTTTPEGEAPVTIFDLVPTKEGAQTGDEELEWSSDCSLEDIFNDTLADFVDPDDDPASAAGY